jgi:hypothetical protein
MAKCIDCGLVTFMDAPHGRLFRCGRRGYYTPSSDWRERVGRQEACKRAAEKLGYTEAQWLADEAAEKQST